MKFTIGTYQGIYYFKSITVLGSWCVVDGVVENDDGMHHRSFRFRSDETR